MLDGDERRGTQDTISRNELAPTNRRDKQKRKKKKRRQKNVVAERSESDRQSSVKPIKLVWTCRLDGQRTATS